MFAEQGGAGAPDWYQKAYDWFQETPYDFKSPSDFTCGPNRGPADAPLFLVNHWVNASPPDPGKAGQANDAKVLRARLEQCATQRNRVPNVVAVDFAERAKIAATVRDVASALRQRVHGTPSTPPVSASPTTTAPPPPTTTPVTVPPADPLPDVTQIPSLTGGDPTQFCTALTNVAPVLTAWAYAEFSGTEVEQGAADLVYGPALARLMTAYVAPAPIEVATLAKPLLARANAAVDTLRQLGLDDDAITALAEQAIQATAVADSPDGVTLQASLTSGLTKQVDEAQFTAAATAFRAAQGDPSTVTDLGYVSDEVAAASGFDICPSVTIG